jgi:hypothetical protein
MYTHFSRHAFERVLERLTLDPEEIAELLDWRLVVPIAEEKGSGRVHLLFYSEPDRLCFVAVQDRFSKTVITILPIDFYENINTRVPWTLQEQARNLATRQHLHPATQEACEETDEVEAAPAPTPLFKIRCIVMNLEESRRNLNLGSWPALDYEHSVERLLRDLDFLAQMRAKIAVQLQPDEYAAGLIIHLGKKGEPFWFRLS